MAGMQRFVTYIYAYENGQKTENAGYAKIEVRGERGQIELHFLNGGIYHGTGKAAFLYEENGKLILIPIGEFSIENGKGNGKIGFQTTTLANTTVGFSKIDGIMISDSEHGMYLSFWRDVKVSNFREENFITYDRQNETVKRLQTQQNQSEKFQENTEKVQEKEEIINQTEELEKETIEDVEEESLHTMELPMQNLFPVHTLENVWQSMGKRKQPLQVNEETAAIQIELSNLRELPKKYWYLGNNSFLLHGFFNYHHILFGKMADGTWFLGVPGIYERQEKVMASIFGFAGFLYLGKKEPLTPHEKQQGIWYHILEE